MNNVLPERDALESALADEDLTPAELDRQLCYLVTVENRVHRLVGEGLRRLKWGDHFMKFGKSTLGDYALGNLGIQPRRAQEMVCIETWIKGFPAIDLAWRQGLLSASHVDLLRRARIEVAEDEVWAERAISVSVRQLEKVLRGAVSASTADAHEEEYWAWLEVEASPEVRLKWQVACEVYSRLIGRNGQPWETLEACGAELTNAAPFRDASDIPITELDYVAEVRKHRQARRKAWAQEMADAEAALVGTRVKFGGMDLGEWPDLTLPDDADPWTIDSRMQAAVSLLADSQNLLMRTLMQAHFGRLHLQWNLQSFHQYVVGRLGLAKSTVDRWLHIEYRLSVTPEVEAEWNQHRLNMTQIQLILEVVNSRTVSHWIDRARSVATLQLKRDVEKARSLRKEYPDMDILPPDEGAAGDDAAHAGVDLSTLVSQGNRGSGKPAASTPAGSSPEPDLADSLCSPNSDAVCESKPDPNAADSLCSLHSESNTSNSTCSSDPVDSSCSSNQAQNLGELAANPLRNPLRVGREALHLPALKPGTIRMRVPIDVLVYVVEYCRRWLMGVRRDVTTSQTFEIMVDAFLAEYLSLARESVHKHAVLERDGFWCMVPGCSRRANLEDHHIIFRSQGGGNETENRVTLCACHHRQGIHQGYVILTGQAPDHLVWKLGLNPDGSVQEVFVGQRRVA